MTDLTSSVLAQLDSSHIDAIARQLGVSPDQAGQAVQQALPLLLGGLARNSASPQGAGALHAALERDHSGVDIGGLLGSVLGGGAGGGNSGPDLGGLIGSVLGGGSGGGNTGGDLGGLIGSVLGGGGSSSNAGVGGAILGHIFGARRDRAAQGLGQSSGLGGAGAAQLLAMLAPLVMSVLGNMSREKGLDARSLGSVLGQENQRIQQGGVGGLLSGVLDSDGDGDLDLGDLLKACSGLLGAFGKHP